MVYDFCTVLPAADTTTAYALRSNYCWKSNETAATGSYETTTAPFSTTWQMRSVQTLVNATLCLLASIDSASGSTSVVRKSI